MHDLNEMRVFLLVGKLGSFTAAAQEANLTLSAVSKRVSRLEQGLGVQLINRTSRSLELTEAGWIFYEKCGRATDLIDEAQNEVRLLGSIPTGRLRVNAPESFGRKCLSPVVAEFLSTYPGIKLELIINSRIRKFEAEGCDVLIRRAEMNDDRLMNDVLYVDRYIVCVSPSYLKSNTVPLFEPQNLSDHNCLIYKYPNIRNTWEFHAGGRILSVRVNGNLICNNYDCVLRSTVDGLGIGCLPSYVAHDDLAAGHLIEIFPNSLVAERPMRAYYFHEPFTPTKVKLFIGFLKRHFAPHVPEAGSASHTQLLLDT
jgi:DNA-binding transcriptional LysR family regulator